MRVLHLSFNLANSCSESSGFLCLSVLKVFYKKVDGPDPTLSIDDDRSACGDSWQMHFEPEKGNGNEGLNRGAGIFAVESNTWYIYLLLPAFILQIF